VRHSGGGVGIAKTTKNAKRQVVGVHVMRAKYGEDTLMVLVGRQLRM
jgi:hypothetical protein